MRGADRRWRALHLASYAECDEVFGDLVFGEQVFGDQVVAAAILERRLHHRHGVTIHADSHRLREPRRSGLRGNSHNSRGNDGRQATPPATDTMSSTRDPSHQGGTTPTTELQSSPGVAQFSLSEVAPFSVSPDSVA